MVSESFTVRDFYTCLAEKADEELRKDQSFDEKISGMMIRFESIVDEIFAMKRQDKDTIVKVFKSHGMWRDGGLFIPIERSV
jgi:hypothetical protein